MTMFGQARRVTLRLPGLVPDPTFPRLHQLIFALSEHMQATLVILHPQSLTYACPSLEGEGLRIPDRGR